VNAVSLEDFNVIECVGIQIDFFGLFGVSVLRFLVAAHELNVVAFGEGLDHILFDLLQPVLKVEVQESVPQDGVIVEFD